MAKRKSRKKTKRVLDEGSRKIFWGLFIIVFALVIYMGYSWEIAAMAVGLLIVIKGILIKMDQ